MLPVLSPEAAPGKAVRVERVDESTEGQTISPAGGEVAHPDLNTVCTSASACILVLLDSPV